MAETASGLQIAEVDPQSGGRAGATKTDILKDLLLDVILRALRPSANWLNKGPFIGQFVPEIAVGLQMWEVGPQSTGRPMQQWIREFGGVLH